MVLFLLHLAAERTKATEGRRDAVNDEFVIYTTYIHNIEHTLSSTRSDKEQRL
jgi:hypothetical protein